MHDSLLMELAEADDDLRNEKLYGRFIKGSLGLQNLVELTASNVGHHEVQALVSLEEVLHAAQEMVIRLEQDLLLQERGLYLIIVNQLVLSDGLDGESFIFRGKMGEVDAPKSTLTKNRL